MVNEASVQPRAAGDQFAVAVSYSWKEEREGVHKGEVAQFCEQLKQAGANIVRDVDRVKHGESLSNFMRTLGASDFLCVFLSDAYLKSPNCMYELMIAWQRSKDNAEQLRQRVKVWVMHGSVSIHDPVSRLSYTDHWKTERDHVVPLIAKHAADGLAASELETFRRIKQFAEHVNEMLVFFSDSLSPGTLADFQEWIENSLETRTETSVDQDQTTDSKYSERISELRSEMQKQVDAIDSDVLKKLASAFDFKIEANEPIGVMRARFFDYLLNGQYKLPRALNRTRGIHKECEASNRRRIKELLIRVCPLRFNTAEIYDEVRKRRRGKVGYVEHAEVQMAGVDGTHACLKDDFRRPGVKSTKLPEIGFPSSMQPRQSENSELKSFLADLYSELCTRLSVSQLSDLSVSDLADELKSMTTTLSEQAYDRTVYCVVSLPNDETHRDYALDLIDRAAELLQDIVWIEYHPDHSAAERDFSQAFAWILNLDD